MGIIGKVKRSLGRVAILNKLICPIKSRGKLFHSSSSIDTSLSNASKLSLYNCVSHDLILHPKYLKPFFDHLNDLRESGISFIFSLMGIIFVLSVLILYPGSTKNSDIYNFNSFVMDASYLDKYRTKSSANRFIYILYSLYLFQICSYSFLSLLQAVRHTEGAATTRGPFKMTKHTIITQVVSTK